MDYARALFGVCVLSAVLSGWSADGQGHLRRNPALFSREVDSFFGRRPVVVGDSAASASIQRPAPFAQNLRPHVVVTNKGLPPAEDAEISDEPFDDLPTFQQQQTPTGRRQSFPLQVVQRQQNSPGFSFPFVAQQPQQQHPGMTIERFPPAEPEQVSRGRSNPNPNDDQNVRFPNNNEFFLFRPETQTSFNPPQREVPFIPPVQNERPRFTEAPNRNNRFREEEFRRPPPERSQEFVPDRRPDSEENRRPPRPKEVEDTRPRVGNNNDHRNIQFFRPEQQQRPEVVNSQRSNRPVEFNPEDRVPVRVVAETARPFVSSVARNFSNPPVRQRIKVNSPSPNEANTVATKDLDAFFGPAKVHSTTSKPIRAKSVIRPSTSARPSPPLRTSSNSKVLSPRIKIVPNRNSEVASRPIESEEETEENDFTETSDFRGHTGINPQFVDFSTLTTQASTISPVRRSSVAPWKTSTPKIRTVVHPPPASALSTPRPKRPMRPSTKAPAIRSTTQSADVDASIRDPTHMFQDIARIGTKRMTSTRRTVVISKRIPNLSKPTDAQKIASTPKPRFLIANQPQSVIRVRKPSLVATSPNSNEFSSTEEEDGPATNLAASNTRFSTPQQDIMQSSNEDDVNANTVSSTSRSSVSRDRTIAIPKRPQDRSSLDSRQVRWRESQSSREDQRGRQPSREMFIPMDEGRRFMQQPQNSQSFQRPPSSRLRPVFPSRFRPTTSDDYLDAQEPTEFDNTPTEPDDQDFRLARPENPVRVTTPLGMRFVNPPSEEEDFPEGNSYEEDFEEDYEEETTTTTTTRRPLITRRPTIRTRIPQNRVPRPKPSETKPPKSSSDAFTPAVTRKPSRTQSKDGESGFAKLGKTKCDPAICQLPECYCGGTRNPGGFAPSDTPQFVLLTFDDAINDLNWPLYQSLYFQGRTNPNGCPILSTFYVSHEWTDYGKVEAMYAAGHEIASHSISHSDGASFSKKKWHDEINGQREILSRYGGVKAEDIQGMRAPFLAIGGNKMFGMLHEDNFTYDSSITVLENTPPSWPYTLDYGLSHECAIPPCPTQSFPGLWEIPMVSLTDLNGGRCSMADSCSYSTTSDGIYEMLMKNFDRHYNSNRAPLGLYYHASWFLTPHRKDGFIRFMDEILQQDDVYFVTSMQMIAWMRNPTPLSQIKNFSPWKCHGKQREPVCRRSRECSISFRGDMRSFRTCGECPSIYPWVGKTNV